MGDVTLLLEAARRGKTDAVDELYALLYKELRAVAHRQLRRRDHYRALDTTVVVHESYLRLRDRGALKPEDRAQFLAYSASAMRSVIVDMARSRLARKRGSDRLVPLHTNIAESHSGTDEQMLRIHDALQELTALEPRLARIVEMRYFVGMSEQEVADALGVSRRTAQRDWEKARLFLSACLEEQPAGPAARGADAAQPRPVSRFVLKSVATGAETELARVMVAGRLPGSDLQLAPTGPSGGPSRRHASLSVIGNEVWLEDLGSKNGTFVNGRRIASPTPLRSGDSVRFDVEEFTFRIERVRRQG